MLRDVYHAGVNYNTVDAQRFTPSALTYCGFDEEIVIVIRVFP
jgi:HD superfamily phosphohydrolase